MTPPRVAVGAAPAGERLVHAAERLLRVVGDARTALVLLLLTGMANAIAALLPNGPSELDAWPYVLLLGAVALSGVAAVAVRSPTVWREWRRPTAVQRGSDTLRLAMTDVTSVAVEQTLRTAGYRTRREESRGRWAVHGVRRGWSRYAGLASHLALVVVILGVAVGAAFGSEIVFTLLRGDQALLDAPRAGFASSVRLEALDAEFGPDARPRRLDTTVTFLRDGEPIREAVLRVNEPGEFDGYLVHPWTYGPAVRIRVTTLGGGPLLDAPVPLPGLRDGVPVGSAELPTAGVTLGLAITDPDRNELGVSVVDGAGRLVDSARLLPGDAARVGDLRVELNSFDAWVTFLSRRDPGSMILFLGAAAMSVSLAVAFWLPRRRLTVRPSGAGVELLLRGERFDRLTDEFDRLRHVLGVWP
ncbi:MAG: cytochrome c biogenesis protein ResB [Chloroflexota bacterium]|nr:cytochrome c biogenesis protein ResB [Chloroflexota bacterium]